MNLNKITQKLILVRNIYLKKFHIKADQDWYLLKIQEELGELTSAHLKLSKRARLKGKSSKELKQNLKHELADVLAMTLLYAKQQKIDLDSALKEKWFKYLE